MRAAQLIALSAFELALFGARLMGQQSGSLREQQERFPRVRTAEQEKGAALRKMLSEWVSVTRRAG